MSNVKINPNGYAINDFVQPIIDCQTQVFPFNRTYGMTDIQYFEIWLSNSKFIGNGPKTNKWSSILTFYDKGTILLDLRLGPNGHVRVQSGVAKLDHISSNPVGFNLENGRANHLIFEFKDKDIFMTINGIRQNIFNFDNVNHKGRTGDAGFPSQLDPLDIYHKNLTDVKLFDWNNKTFPWYGHITGGFSTAKLYKFDEEDSSYFVEAAALRSTQQNIDHIPEATEPLSYFFGASVVEDDQHLPEEISSIGEQAPTYPNPIKEDRELHKKETVVALWDMQRDIMPLQCAVNPRFHSDSGFANLEDVRLIEFMLCLDARIGKQPLITLASKSKKKYLQLGVSIKNPTQYSRNKRYAVEMFNFWIQTDSEFKEVPMQKKNWGQNHFYQLIIDLGVLEKHGIALRAGNGTIFFEMECPLFKVEEVITGFCDFGYQKENDVPAIDGFISTPSIWKQDYSFYNENGEIEIGEKTPFHLPLILRELANVRTSDYKLYDDIELEGYGILVHDFDATMRTLFPMEIGSEDMINIIEGRVDPKTSYFTSTNLKHQIAGHQTTMDDISLVDLWVVVGATSNELECVFEFADGLQEGNLWGLYIEKSASGKMRLKFKANRIHDIENSDRFTEPHNELDLGYNHILIEIRKKKNINSVSEGYSLYEAAVCLNGERIYEEQNQRNLAFDALNAFSLNFVSVGKSLTGEFKFHGKVIGPRLWNNHHMIALPKLWPFIPAYAFSYYKDYLVFGEHSQRMDAFGTLKGFVQDISYTKYVLDNSHETVWKGESPKVKKKEVDFSRFLLTSPETANINFDFTGTHFHALPNRIWRNEELNDGGATLNIDLGQEKFPYPLRKNLIGYPHNLNFLQIQTIEFWVKPVMIPKAALGKVKQTLFCLKGKAVSPSKIEKFLVQLDPEKKTLNFVKTLNTGKGVAITMHQEQDSYYFPDLWNGKFHHICIQKGNNPKNRSIKVTINGMKKVRLGPPIFLNFDMEIEMIYGAADEKGFNAFEGEMCGPRFWRGEEWGQNEIRKAAFSNYKHYVSPSFLEKSQLVGKLQYLVDKGELEEYRKTGSFSMEHLHKSYGFSFTPVNIEHFRKFIGMWVHKDQNYRVPVQENRLLHGVANEMHCVYKSSSFLCIDEDPITHKIHLVTNGGIRYILGKHTHNFGVFHLEGSPEKEAFYVYFEKSTVEKGFMEIDTGSRPIRRYTMHIRSNHPNHIESGQYEVPFKKLEVPNNGRDNDFGNIFLHRLTNLNPMLMGYDITRVDPMNMGNEGTTGFPIFRLPPTKSRRFDLSQGVAVPFGWHYIPFSSFHSDKTVRFLSSQSEIESATSTGISHSYSKDDTENAGGGYGGEMEPTGGSANIGHEQGISSQTNEVTALRVKEVVEEQSFTSMHQWFCSSHDMVLDPNNILFDGEITEHDEEINNLGTGFYWDLVGLLKVKNNERQSYFEFISKYGTHYLASARYGARGYKMHTFSSNTVSTMETAQAKISETKNDSDKLNLALKAKVRGVKGEGGVGYSIKKSDGTELDDSDANGIRSNLKEEKEISSSRGAYTETGMDTNGEIHVFRNYKKLHTLVGPPYFADMELVGHVRPKLKQYINEYIEYRRKNFPRPEYKNVTRVYKVSIKPKFKFDPSPEAIIERQPDVYKGIPIVPKEQVFEKYLGTLKLDIEIKGEKKSLSWVYNHKAENYETREFEIIKRSKLVLDGKMKEPDLEVKCMATSVLDAKLVSVYRGIKPEDEAKHKKEIARDAAIGGSVFGFIGAGIGALVGHIHGKPAESKEPKVDIVNDNNDKVFDGNTTLTVSIADTPGTQKVSDPILDKYFSIEIEDIELEASSLF